mmetsp:Transcript_20070/g.34540  ORF Transcript_20070/g.34540 Transcript_20070/m.34540 type:complete len:451 (-) Transcript_20070:350-1702(-)|eukprot:CAMPEP_0196658132 /NCGR_PEP_ID=MMETSP1086-20130531/27505_1 /TAXON_ID=77921 /ORGANISM="Cyanoptyche  gloeocystis , Strain SAG4.97" /LENGTH=450 /DNA_ID=CAMNT_0041991563 /DNA_START=84 /DNA_END=1436 /DNA_ORIENTATION=-
MEANFHSLCVTPFRPRTFSEISLQTLSIRNSARQTSAVTTGCHYDRPKSRHFSARRLVLQQAKFDFGSAETALRIVCSVGDSEAQGSSESVSDIKQQLTTPDVSAPAPEASVSTATGGGGDSGSKGGSTGGNGGGKGDGEGDENAGENSEFSNPEKELDKVLKRCGKTADALPADIRSAILAGVCSPAVAENYFKNINAPLIGVFMSLFKSYRDRVLADPSVTAKIVAEQGIGIPMTILGEVNARRDNFWVEIEYVLANMLVGCAVNFGLVWFLSPVLNTKTTAGTSILSIIDSLPSNVFDRTRQFSLSQRIASFFVKGLTYGVVGFFAGGVGASLTTLIVQGQKAFNPNYVSTTKPPAILGTALGWAGFLAVSSNTRYQLVNGVESVIYPMFPTQPLIPIAATWLLRLGNTFWGVSQWIWLSRFFGLQPAADSDDSAKNEAVEEPEPSS